MWIDGAFREILEAEHISEGERDGGENHGAEHRRMTPCGLCSMNLQLPIG